MRMWLRHILATPFASALALLAAESGVRGLVDATSLPLLSVIGWIGYAWAVVYGTGGALILYGIASTRTKWEAAGCSLFGGGALVQAIVTAFYVGRNPFLNLWSVFALSTFGIAGLVRARHLSHGQKLILVGRVEE